MLFLLLFSFLCGVGWRNSDEIEALKETDKKKIAKTKITFVCVQR